MTPEANHESPKGEKQRETPEADRKEKTEASHKRLKVSEKENVIQQNLANKQPLKQFRGCFILFFIYCLFIIVL